MIQQVRHYQGLELIPTNGKRKKRKKRRKKKDEARSAPVSSSLPATISSINVTFTFTFTFLLLLLQNIVGGPFLFKYDNI